jgi:hypothetical protein
MRKPALPPSAFLLDMADARLENTLCRSPQKKEKKKKKSQSLQSLSVAVAAVVTQRFAPAFRTLPSTLQC